MYFRHQVVRHKSKPFDNEKPLSREINELVGKVNGRFGTADYTPVLQVRKSLPHNELVALLNIADVCMVSSTRYACLSHPALHTWMVVPYTPPHGVMPLLFLDVLSLLLSLCCCFLFVFCFFAVSP